LTFVIVYNYKIPSDKTNEYITLEKQAIQIYLEYGCKEVQIYRDAKKPNRWMEINLFDDQETYQRVIEKVNKDSRMEMLYRKFVQLLYEGEPEPEKKSYYRIL
jgi:quinol monooxygenase YgiN